MHGSCGSIAAARSSACVRVIYWYLEQTDFADINHPSCLPCVEGRESVCVMQMLCHSVARPCTVMALYVPASAWHRMCMTARDVEPTVNCVLCIAPVHLASSLDQKRGIPKKDGLVLVHI
jgi:hypothetical protein